MFQVIYAHEWMNNAHVHEMQVQLCKPITRGVKIRRIAHWSWKDVMLLFMAMVIAFLI